MLNMRKVLNFLDRLLPWRMVFLSAIALCITIYPLILSISAIGLLVHWLLEEGLLEKWENLKQRKSLWVFCSILLIHIIGLSYSEDFNSGFNDIIKKLPIVSLPLILGTIPALNPKQFKILLHFFLLGIVISSIICAVNYFFNNSITNVREISIFISHIRYSLLINLGIFVSLFFVFSNYYSTTAKEKIIFSFVAFWFVVFLFILKAFTGIIIFFLLSFIWLIVFTLRMKNGRLKYLLFLLHFSFFSFGIVFFLLNILNFYKTDETVFVNPEPFTINGNPYEHIPELQYLENGNYVWMYVCKDELRSLWQKRSSLNFDSTDLKGQKLSYTVIRYLTSVGLRKDSVGLASLSDSEIRNIEKGYANCRYVDNNSLSNRFYGIIWEIDIFLKGGNSSGHSLTQRFEYLKTAIYIIKENPLWGVGTGDVKIAFKQMYEKTNSKLELQFRRTSHNQYITFILTFGLPLGLCLIFALFFPAILEKKKRNVLLYTFLIIALVSMLNEDTLETQIGATFFGYFFALFLYAAPEGLGVFFGKNMVKVIE